MFTSELSWFHPPTLFSFVWVAASSCPFLNVEIWLFFARKLKHCPEVKAPPGEMGGCVVECNGMIILQLTFMDPPNLFQVSFTPYRSLISSKGNEKLEPISFSPVLLLLHTPLNDRPISWRGSKYIHHVFLFYFYLRVCCPCTMHLFVGPSLIHSLPSFESNSYKILHE